MRGAWYFLGGDELRDPGTPVDQLRYGDIYDANRITLLQLLKGLPVDCVDLGCFLPDDPEAVSSTQQRCIDMRRFACQAVVSFRYDADFIVEQIPASGERNSGV